MNLTKPKYQWASIRSQTLKRLALIFLATFLALISWAGLRYWEYQQEAPLRAGISAFKGGDYPTALEKILPFARSGNSTAQELLGYYYAKGLGGRTDELRARIWYRRAECGCLDTGRAEYFIGVDYLKGNVVQKNSSEALKWFQYSAEAGYQPAQQLLANPTELATKGLPVDPEVSKYWKNFLQKE